MPGIALFLLAVVGIAMLIYGQVRICLVWFREREFEMSFWWVAGLIVCWLDILAMRVFL